MKTADELLKDLDYLLVGETEYELLFKKEEDGLTSHLLFDKKRQRVDHYPVKNFHSFMLPPMGADLLEAVEAKKKEYGWKLL